MKLLQIQLAIKYVLSKKACFRNRVDWEQLAHFNELVRRLCFFMMRAASFECIISLLSITHFLGDPNLSTGFQTRPCSSMIQEYFITQGPEAFIHRTGLKKVCYERRQTVCSLHVDEDWVFQEKQFEVLLYFNKSSFCQVLSSTRYFLMLIDSRDQ